MQGEAQEEVVLLEGLVGVPVVLDLVLVEVEVVAATTLVLLQVDHLVALSSQEWPHRFLDLVAQVHLEEEDHWVTLC